jgi:hypothetical protein
VGILFARLSADEERLTIMGAKPYHAVLFVTVPADWRPTRVFHLPPSFSEAKYYAKRLPLHMAIEIARAYNRARLLEANAGQPIGTWCLQVRALKTHGYGSPHSRQTPRDPASTRSMTVAKGGGI